MNKVFNVIMKAKDIPSRSIVTKRSGDKEYMIVDQINIYPCGAVHHDHVGQSIKTTDDKRLLCAGPYINEVFKDTMLIWKTDLKTLINYCELGKEYHND